MRALSIATILVLGTFLASAQINYQPKTIKVNGSAEKEVEPNEIHLEVQLKDVNEKHQTINMVTAREEFNNICTSAGVNHKDITMTNHRSQMVSRIVSFWRTNRTDIIQRETYEIKFTDMEKLLACIEKLDKPFVESLNFAEQTHTELLKFRKEVKEEAAKAAIEKATYLAKASGQEIGKVIYIEEVSENYLNTANQYSNTISYEKRSYGGDAKVNFGFKPIRLRYEVKVICELK